MVGPPVKVGAAGLGLGVFQPERIKSPDSLALLTSLRPEVLVTAAYGQILTSSILALPSVAAINVHASLLPKYRGPDPIRRAIMSAEARTGVTIMHMDRRVDAGDIIWQEGIPIGSEETFGSLERRLAGLGARLAVEVLDLLATGQAPRSPQEESLATYAPALEREDEEVHWDKGAEEIAALIRALDPEPGAHTHLGEMEVKIWRARPWTATPIAGGLEQKPGRVTGLEKGRGILVACGPGTLLLEEVQPAGGRRMEALAFANGYRIKAGTLLGDR